jgi:glycosyltransferase involved in cell wall biosynthesis
MRHNLTDVLIDHFSVYYATDDLTVNIVGDTLSDDVEAERHLLSKMNLVICNNDELARRLRERFPSSRRPPIRVLPNFYDERIFNPNKTYPEPPGLHNVPTPRILVAGHISERLDWDGIAAASELRPHWTWVFLSRGTAPGMKKNIYGKLGSRGYWHPAVPLGEVPAWIRSCDGCAVPYRLNSFTLASDPTKATEYLAMGAPVLSTRVPALARYDQAVAWVEEGDGESYASALDILARQSGNQELKMLRQKAVAGESLNTRVSQFQKTVLSHANP